MATAEKTSHFLCYDAVKDGQIEVLKKEGTWDEKRRKQ
jgi:hypothetical protein